MKMEIRHLKPSEENVCERYELDDNSQELIPPAVLNNEGMSAVVFDELNPDAHPEQPLPRLSGLPLLIPVSGEEAMKKYLMKKWQNPLWFVNRLFLHFTETDSILFLHHLISREFQRQNYHSLNLILHSQMDQIEYAGIWLKRFCYGLFPELSSYDFFEFNLIIRELLTNAIKHGNAHDPEKTVKFVVYMLPEDGVFGVLVKDDGPGFDFHRRLHSIETDELRQNQRGLFLMNEFCSRIYSNKNIIITEFNKKFI